jgi:hypothetical protein
MKKVNITSLILCLTFSVLLFSCDNEDDTPDIDADVYESLSDLVEELKPEMQTFTIDPTAAQTVTGEDGTVINIDANAFTDENDDPITTPITVNLREHLTLEDMILSNAQTSSDNSLLVTGGSFNLTFEDENGNGVNVNPWAMNAQIPVQTDITGFENEMKYYVGTTTEVDGREMVDWDLSGQSETFFRDGVFNIFGLEQGLANCDVLYDLAGESPTQFEVTVTGIVDYTKVIVWLVIEDFPSVVMITQLNDTETALQTYAGSIPTGLEASLIAITVDEDNYLKFGSLDITVAGDDTFNVDIDFGTTEDLISLIQAIAG